MASFHNVSQNKTTDKIIINEVSTATVNPGIGEEDDGTVIQTQPEVGQVPIDDVTNPNNTLLQIVPNNDGHQQSPDIHSGENESDHVVHIVEEQQQHVVEQINNTTNLTQTNVYDDELSQEDFTMDGLSQSDYMYGNSGYGNPIRRGYINPGRRPARTTSQKLHDIELEYKVKVKSNHKLHVKIDTKPPPAQNDDVPNPDNTSTSLQIVGDQRHQQPEIQLHEVESDHVHIGEEFEHINPMNLTQSDFCDERLFNDDNIELDQQDFILDELSESDNIYGYPPPAGGGYINPIIIKRGIIPPCRPPSRSSSQKLLDIKLEYKSDIDTMELKSSNINLKNDTNDTPNNIPAPTTNFKHEPESSTTGEKSDTNIVIMGEELNDEGHTTDTTTSSSQQHLPIQMEQHHEEGRGNVDDHDHIQSSSTIEKKNINGPTPPNTSSK